MDSSSVARYRRLEPSRVVATVDRLRRRIEARFPERGLTRVAGELSDVAGEVVRSTAGLAGRLRWIRRLSTTLGIVVVVATLVTLGASLSGALTRGPERSFEWLPLIESTINDVVFAAVAVYFLLALPNRIERGHILARLHRLRSLAHIVDMHQLTKDPERLRPDFDRTSESVEPHLSRPAMEHYLDYCSELLSLIGKIAALCAEKSQDPVVLDTVSTIETLTTGMSRKIWMKISLLPD